MRLRKAPRIQLDLAKAVPQVFFSAAQASVAAFILYTLAVSTNIVENPIQGNRIGHNMQVSIFILFHIPFELHQLFVE